MSDRRKTFLKVVFTMILGYAFIMTAIVLYMMFFIDIWSKPVTNAALYILCAMVSTIMGFAFLNWSDKLQHNFDLQEYDKWR
tara:strand:+ start:560 stop:805 length:246 start_codon:yes stop_codon:yes gene_type:complete